ncbi:MAG: hypothetical protein WCF68_07315 [Terriglobales bacterium]
MLVKQTTNPKASSIWANWAPQCANPACATKTFLQAFTRRQRGLKIENLWYCTTECFQQVTKRKIEDLINSQGKPAKARTSRVPLGLLLLQRGILTSEQLKAALDHQKLSGLDFGETVQHLGFATQEHVTAAVAAQWACPVFPVGDRPLSVQIRIPRKFLDLYGMLPVHYAEKERNLLVGFVRSVQPQLLYTIGHITSCTVAPCFITAREYQLHLNSPSVSLLRDNELVFDQLVETAEMARVTTNYAVQLAADRVRLGICRDYLWVRIWGPKQEMDLLFRIRND